MKTPLWRQLMVGAGIALVGSLAGWLGKTTWGGIKDSITEGKADSDVVQTIKTDNDSAHTVINKKIDRVDTRTKEQGRVLRSVARKLHVPVSEPEPKDE